MKSFLKTHILRRDDDVDGDDGMRKLVGYFPGLVDSNGSIPVDTVQRGLYNFLNDYLTGR